MSAGFVDALRLPNFHSPERKKMQLASRRQDRLVIVRKRASFSKRALCTMVIEGALNRGMLETIERTEFNRYVQNTYARYPVTLVSGQGATVWDDTGRTYIDCVAGIATCSLGHADARLVAAVSDQIRRLHHVSNLYYTAEQAKLARWLVENSCGDRVFFCNSGAEANEAALKLVRKYAHTELNLDLPVVITAQNSFHGRTLATITATGQPKYQHGFEPLMPGFCYVPYNDINALERTVSDLIQAQKSWWRRVRGAPRMGLAAIMLEALQGEGGVRPGDPAFFAAARRICDETGALLVMDEVQVGMGRTGKLFGFENLSVEPDVFTLAKGLGGGIPIGAMICNTRLRDVLQPGEHASTFGGNPLACRAGLVVTHALTEDGVLENVRARGAQLRKALDALVDAFPTAAKEARGWGLIQGLELREPRAAQLVQAALKEGVLLVPAGPSVVRFVPPLTITERELDEALQATQRAFESVFLPVPRST
jgi:acetylornithine aminotransferase